MPIVSRIVSIVEIHVSIWETAKKSPAVNAGEQSLLFVRKAQDKVDDVVVDFRINHAAVGFCNA